MPETMPRKAKILIAGIFFVRMALFMSYPFLALHLGDLHFSALDIGIIFGCHYFFAGCSGIFGGNIADRWNPRYPLIASLFIGAISFFGLSQATSFESFLFFNCCLAISTSTFEPIASMLITANITSDQYALAFRYRYMAINAGAAIGPLLGALLISQGSSFSFFLTGSLLTIFSLSFLFLRISQQTPSQDSQEGSATIREVLLNMAQNPSFLLLIGANLFVTMTYSQIFSALPQILHAHIDNSRVFYSIILTVNPIIVIGVSLLFNQFLSKQSLKRLLSCGSLLLSASFLGFHFAPITYVNYIFFMAIFTLAEIFLIPTTSKFLLDLAPERYRGAYLGAESTTYLGFFIGNLMGGWLLQNGQGVFLFCSFSALGGFVLYQLAILSYSLKNAAVPE